MTVYHRQEDEDAAREAYERGDPKHPDSGPVGEVASDPDYSHAYQDEYQRLWHEAAARVKKLEEALEAYDRWASSMPDAGFSDKSPRWAWWHKRPADIARAALSEEQG